MRARFQLDARIAAIGLFSVYLGLAAAAAAKAPAEWIVALEVVAALAFGFCLLGTLAGRAPLGVGSVVLGAIAFRMLFLPIRPALSDDVWRYLWDGRVAAAGINPYRFAPDDAALTGLHDATWKRVNHREIPTIYPPFAQVLFRTAAAGGGLPAWKALTLLCDAVTLAALLGALRITGVRVDLAILYAWNPLILTEVAWNAHMDAAAVALLACAVLASLSERPRWAVGLASLAAGVKLYPAAVLPLLIGRAGWRRTAWIPVAVAAIGLAPYLDAGWPALTAALRIYGGHWEFNGPLYTMLRGWIRDPMRVRVTLGIAAAIGIALVTRRPKSRQLPDAMLQILGLAIVLSPTVHPWYVTWLVPLLPLASRPPRLACLLLTLLVPLSYVVLAVREATGRWFLPPTFLWLEWLPVFAVLAFELGWAGASRATRSSTDRQGVEKHFSTPC